MPVSLFLAVSLVPFCQYWGAAIQNLRNEYQDVPGVDDWFQTRMHRGDSLYTILDTMHTIDLLNTLREAREGAVHRQQQLHREAEIEHQRQEPTVSRAEAPNADIAALSNAKKTESCIVKCSIVIKCVLI